MQTFHIGDILTITTGKLLSLKGVDGIYEILNYMTDGNWYTHELPEVWTHCKPYLLEQFPELASVAVQSTDEEGALKELAELELKHGSHFEVRKITAEAL